jgi:CheY-like chemotaxis protein
MPALEGKRVLVIEDTAENMRLFRAVLKLEGVEVKKPRTRRDASRWPQRESPDLILMDIQMPEMDGLTATRLLRAEPKTAHIPIVAVTASLQRKTAAKRLKPGCDGHIPKPIDPSVFGSNSSGFLKEKGRLPLNENKSRSASNQPTDTPPEDDLSGGWILVVDRRATTCACWRASSKSPATTHLTAASAPNAGGHGIFINRVVMLAGDDSRHGTVLKSVRPVFAGPCNASAVVMVTGAARTGDRIKALSAVPMMS